MKGHPPLYQGEPGGARPASADPLKLIQWALQNGYPVQMVDFGRTVKEVRFRRKLPPSGTCYHQPSGETDLVGVLNCGCGQQHAARERCAACGEFVPFHDFPGREPRVAVLTVEAPAPVGEQLKGPAEDRDAFVLIHVPRAAVDEMDSPIERPKIVIPGVN